MPKNSCLFLYSKYAKQTGQHFLDVPYIAVLSEWPLSGFVDPNPNSGFIKYVSSWLNDGPSTLSSFGDEPFVYSVSHVSVY